MLSPCIGAFTSAGGESPRDAYVTASISDARILIPFFADDTASAGICRLVFSGLTKIDKDLNVVGDLAERWDISADGLEISFFLRKNVNWHDGVPFTADDVKFTFDTILDPSTACPYVGEFTDIDDITVIDRNRVKFRYKKPSAPALNKLGMGIIPKHLFESVANIRDSAYARDPVGTGPYKFERWVTGEYIVLEADTGHYIHSPRIKRYVYRVIPDQSVGYYELLAGGIDSMDLNPYQYFIRSETPEFRSKIDKYRYLAPSYTYMGYNLLDPILSDIRVRKALGYAVDRKEIIDSVLLGLGEICSGHFIRDSPYYDPGVDGLYGYDPAKAALLLKEAGWSDTDGDGILEKNGAKLVLKIVTNQGNQVREDVATVVQRHWKKLGIKADIQVVAWSAFIDQFIDKKNFQVALLAWGLTVDPDCYTVWHSASAKNGGLNFVSYSNPEVDALIEAGRAEFDKEKRIGIYRDIHRRIAEDAPYTFLFFSYATPAINKRFHGIKPAPAGIAYNLIDWYVPEREVKYNF
ncbi:MAG: peptide-binding protein [Candidatus Omnitrophica bacterium]|nr:peptide-binding protein [Candidatus Omnitrophota bacterium]